MPVCLEFVDDAAESGLSFVGVCLSALAIGKAVSVIINTVRVHDGLEPIVYDEQEVMVATELIKFQ